MSKIVTSTFGGIALGPNSDGRYVIGGTNDILYGGDMSGDEAGYGITLASEDGKKHFALAVYGDDGGTAYGAGWTSAIFGSNVIHTTIASGNVSGFATSGQMHIGASIATTGNLGGVYGVIETDDTVTLAGNCFGGVFGATIPSTVTGHDSYWMGGILIGGTNAGGTTTNNYVGIYFQNPGANVAFDGIFGLDSAQTTAGSLSSQTRYFPVMVRIGGAATATKMYIPIYAS
jgi:hypothetical protein